jgi:hypothetical protein
MGAKPLELVFWMARRRSSFPVVSGALPAACVTV